MDNGVIFPSTEYFYSHLVLYGYMDAIKKKL